jgi:hypothetical protein
VHAELVQASLFGSHARGDARSNSDVDLLLIFRHLPEDREPYASQAERIAESEADRHRVPVTVWSVSLIDLAVGNRTPMLVDALADSLPLWCRNGAIPVLPFTRRDALGCVGALLRRVDEGSAEFASHLALGDLPAAARRVRDDLVRLCTAASLLHGVTRPRRGEAARNFIAHERPPAHVRSILIWAERSFGIDGKDEEAPMSSPPGGWGAAALAVGALKRGIVRRAERLRARLDLPPDEEMPGGEGMVLALDRMTPDRESSRIRCEIRP